MDIREFNIRDYLNVIYKRKRIAIALFSIAFTIIVIATISSPPIYRASTKLIIERVHQPVLPSQFSYYPFYDPEFYETQYQLIKSAAVGRRVAEMLFLDGEYKQHLKAKRRFSPGWLKGLFRPSDTQSEESEGEGSNRDSVNIEALTGMISGGISVAPEKDTRIVTISYTSSNPVLTSLVANSVAKAYIEQILEMRMTSTRYTMDWMKEKSDEERKRLAQSEQILQDYIKANDIVTMENRVAVIPKKLTELSSQLLKAESRVNELEALYSKIQNINDLNEAEKIPPLTHEPTLQALRRQVLDAEQNIVELSKKYGEKHPVMIRANEELESLMEKKKLEITRIIDALRNEYDLAKANEANTRRFLMETKEETLNLNEKLIQYETLRKESETNRQLYDVLVKKMKEQSLTEHVKTVDVWILESAREPRAPIKPNIPQNVLMGFLFSLFLSIGSTFIIEHFDNTIRTPEDAEERLGVPIIGMVPFFSEGGLPFEGIVTERPKSTYAEMYKHIRTSLMLSSAEKPPKSILITSVLPKEGKTATSINLSLALSQSENSVLLVDTDLRKPTIHKVFNLDNRTGLSSYLAGAAELEIKSLADRNIGNLNVITAGPVPPNPSELLGSRKLISLMEELKSKYDIIIFDSTPLLVVTDALILSKHVDGTVLVLRSNKTTYELARKGLKSMRDLDSNILGIMVNAIDVKKHSYYSYNYYHYYSSEDEEKKQ
jgi:capsular exopolysaccharide synthesis family protein